MCIFPAIPSDLLDDVINGTLELTYSLVAASVPGLDNLHLMSQFQFAFVADPVIIPFNETYQVGSNEIIIINVSMCIYINTIQFQCFNLVDWKILGKTAA